MEKEKNGIDEVRVQDRETKLVRNINRRSYELAQSKYILLRPGQKTEEEVQAEERQELAELRRENARLKAEAQANAQEEVQAEEEETEESDETVEETGTIETPTRKKPGPKPKNAQTAE